MPGFCWTNLKTQPPLYPTAPLDPTGHLLRHACRRGLLALEKDAATASVLRRELDQDMQHIIRTYKNRPGGLADSVARF